MDAEYYRGAVVSTNALLESLVGRTVTEVILTHIDVTTWEIVGKPPRVVRSNREVVQEPGEDDVLDSLVLVFGEAGSVELSHRQDCCESVSIEEIYGDLGSLVGYPLRQCEESSSELIGDGTSETWTFYKLGTLVGRVTVRWHGVSNGYYSEAVDAVWTGPGWCVGRCEPWVCRCPSPSAAPARECPFFGYVDNQPPKGG